MEGSLIPLGFFAMVLAIVYLRQQRRERLLMIEKGMDPKNFETTLHPTRSLKWGIVLVGLGLGMLIANVLARTEYFKQEEAYFTMLFLFGGASLLLFYFIDYRRRKKQEKK